MIEILSNIFFNPQQIISIQTEYPTFKKYYRIQIVCVDKSTCWLGEFDTAEESDEVIRSFVGKIKGSEFI